MQAGTPALGTLACSDSLSPGWLNEMAAPHFDLDQTLVALADPTRRAILQRLSRGEARVTELAHPFPISLNSVSKHIRMLERAQLVRRRRSGREHLLSFNPQPLLEAAAWIESRRTSWTARLDTLDSVLQAEDAAAAKAPRKNVRVR